MISIIEKRESGKFLVQDDRGAFAIIKTPDEIADAVAMARVIMQKGEVSVSMMQQKYFPPKVDLIP